MTEIIELTDTARLLIKTDDGPSCPRGDWHMLTGFVKIPGHGDSRRGDVPAVHDDPIGILKAYDHFDMYDWSPYTDVLYRRRERSYELVKRWAFAFHGMHVEYDREHGGFWFVAGADAKTAATPVDDYSRALFYDNWPELTLWSAEHRAMQEKVIEQEQETYRQWAEGEVYGVILERSETWCRILSDGTADRLDTRNEWDEVDSLWGCYLDDDYTAKVVACESFDLTEEEEAACNT